MFSHQLFPLSAALLLPAAHLANDPCKLRHNHPFQLNFLQEIQTKNLHHKTYVIMNMKVTFCKMHSTIKLNKVSLKIELYYKPLLKFLVAVWSSERLKFVNEDLKLYKLLSCEVSLVLLLFPFDSFGTPRGGKEAKRLIDLFFHNLKNLLQLEFEPRISISVELFLEEPLSDSNPLMQASKTPLGDDTSSFSFSMSKHLKST
jgi:hypothetical protein